MRAPQYRRVTERASAGDDRLNLDDLAEVQKAVTEAMTALKAAMDGQGPAERERLLWNVGFARGRLSRIYDRISRGGDDAAPPSYICPGCGAVSYNLNDLANRYCGRCHQFGDDDAP
jgi:hypothetical protein